MEPWTSPQINKLMWDHSNEVTKQGQKESTSMQLRRWQHLHIRNTDSSRHLYFKNWKTIQTGVKKKTNKKNTNNKPQNRKRKPRKLATWEGTKETWSIQSIRKRLKMWLAQHLPLSTQGKYLTLLFNKRRQSKVQWV